MQHSSSTNVLYLMFTYLSTLPFQMRLENNFYENCQHIPIIFTVTVILHRNTSHHVSFSTNTCSKIQILKLFNEIRAARMSLPNSKAYYAILRLKMLNS